MSIDGEEPAIEKQNEMMAVRLHGSKLSTCTQRVMLVLNELELPYEFVALDMGKGEHKVNRFELLVASDEADYIVRHQNLSATHIRSANFLPLKMATCTCLSPEPYANIWSPSMHLRTLYYCLQNPQRILLCLSRPHLSNTRTLTLVSSSLRTRSCSSSKQSRSGN